MGKISKFKEGELYILYGDIYVFDGSYFIDIDRGGYPVNTSSANNARKATDKDILEVLNNMVRQVIIRNKMDEVDRQHQQAIYDLNAKKSKILCDLWFSI